jgi:hypothetical protein
MQTKPIPTLIENPSGLHGRYFIKKVIGAQALLEVPHPQSHREGWEYGRRMEWKQVFNTEGLPDGTKLRPMLSDTDDEAEYFVLRLDQYGSDPEHIKAGRIGIHAYADAIEHHLPQLAQDLRERYPLL